MARPRKHPSIIMTARDINQSPLVRIDLGEVALATRYLGGTGVPVVFIHGSFDDHMAWAEVIATLPRDVTNPLLVFDRRGHSASTDMPGQGVMSQDMADVAALIHRFASPHAHVVGHSYGANIAIALAISQPQLVASLVLYEPPAFGLLAEVPALGELRAEMKAHMTRAAQLLDAGQVEQGTRWFIEQVAFGVGSWAAFDARTRATMLTNADTWLDQSKDPERLELDLTRLADFPRRLTLIGGKDSLVSFRHTNAQFIDRLPDTHAVDIDGADHAGITTHARQVSTLLSSHLSATRE